MKLKGKEINAILQLQREMDDQRRGMKLDRKFLKVGWMKINKK